MTFEDMLLRAKLGDEIARCWFLDKYKPLIIKNSIVAKRFDEDLYQELCVVLMKCIEHFVI